ncbi:uncharacterized protein [Macaca nemestrina]|uniref:uncharacterized protein n=1 Tax=Macaca nemestrina TaxID=9545 RepID=UPI0039B929B3
MRHGEQLPPPRGHTAILNASSSMTTRLSLLSTWASAGPLRPQRPLRSLPVGSFVTDTPRTPLSPSELIMERTRVGLITSQSLSCHTWIGVRGTWDKNLGPTECGAEHLPTHGASPCPAGAGTRAASHRCISLSCRCWDLGSISQVHLPILQVLGPGQHLTGASPRPAGPGTRAASHRCISLSCRSWDPGSISQVHLPVLQVLGPGQRLTGASPRPAGPGTRAASHRCISLSCRSWDPGSISQVHLPVLQVLGPGQHLTGTSPRPAGPGTRAASHRCISLSCRSWDPGSISQVHLPVLQVLGPEQHLTESADFLSRRQIRNGLFLYPALFTGNVWIRFLVPENVFLTEHQLPLQAKGWLKLSVISKPRENDQRSLISRQLRLMQGTKKPLPVHPHQKGTSVPQTS